MLFRCIRRGSVRKQHCEGRGGGVERFQPSGRERSREGIKRFEYVGQVGQGRFEVELGENVN